MRLIWVIVLVTTVQALTSCKAYKRDLMLQFDEKFSATDVEKSISRVADNYVIKSGDYVGLDVFTNDGERLIDPNFELSTQGAGNQQLAQFKDRFTYLVLADGTCRFPKIGTLSIQNLTIEQGEELIQEAFNEFYKEAFVKLRSTNRRVTVLGAIGGGQSGSGGVVIPLANENVNILEVLALAGGVNQGGKVSSVRLIRGDLNDPKVYDMDLSTISGMKKGGMVVESGDVIYVEPWRRPFRETLSDISPIISLITSMTTLVFVIQNSNTK
ncbi:MAG: polysaccharide export protein EpsE [Cytophagales bacterium]|nr:polysaccharide export protein EpsE [Cytophagales bacterium]